MNQLMEKLAKFEKFIGDFSGEIKTTKHNLTQADNDLNSLRVNIDKKRKELAKIEMEVKTRLLQFEEGLDKIKKQYETKLAEVEIKKSEANKLINEAQRDLLIAKEVRSEAEATRNQVNEVAQAQVRRNVGRPKKVKAVV